MKAVGIGAGIVALVIAAVSIFDPFGGDSSDGGGARGIYTVQRQTLMLTLTERGSLKTKNAKDIRSATHAKIEWMVDEGTPVKKGDVLIRLDATEAENKLEQVQSQRTQLEAEMNSATTEEQIQVDQNKTDLEKAQLSLDIAREELRKLETNDIPAETRKKQLAIEETEVAVKQETDKLAAKEELLKEDFVSANDVEEARLRVRRAQNNHETAVQEAESYRTFTVPLERKKSRSAVTEAERALERTRKKGEAQLSTRRARVQQKRTELRRVQVQQARLETMLAQMILKAPTDGTVLAGRVEHRRGDQEVRVGTQVWPNMILMTLPDPSEMSVVIEVHEADIAKIKKGMAAHVVSETVKGRIFDATVVKIDQVANAGRRWWGGDNVNRFKVELSIKGKDLGLKTGTSARVELSMGKVEKVLAVPLQAIHTKEGGYFCYRADGDGHERVAVEPGRSNETMVEIRTGLSEGDQILLYDPEGGSGNGNGGGESGS